MEEFTPDGPIVPPAEAELVPDGPIMAPQQPSVTLDDVKETAGNAVDFMFNPQKYDDHPVDVASPLPAPPGIGTAISGVANRVMSSPAAQKVGELALEYTPKVAGAVTGYQHGGVPGAVIGWQGGGALGKLTRALPPGAIGNAVSSAVGTASQAVPQAAAAGAQAVEAAYRNSPKQGAIAHYLTSQRDPAYAASLQKKEGK